jgi:phosphatidylinositol alpha-mannosyltransferase
MALPLGLSSQVRTLLQRESFDIVHAHEPLFPSLSPIVLGLASCPKIGTFHAYHRKPRGYWLFKPILKRWFKRLDGLIAVSLPAKEFISKHFPAEYEIVPNGVDVNFFSPSIPPLKQFRDGKKNILFVGRLEKRKGIEYLIKAFRLVKGDLPQSRLIILGPGARLRQKYERVAQGIPDIVFLGNIPYNELPRYYASADVFCCPATGEESFGMVLLEAMAMGKPVVATNIAGYAQLVEQGKEGVLVAPKDEMALAQAIISLLDNPSLAQEMGERGRLKAEAYSWEGIANKIMGVYHRFT